MFVRSYLLAALVLVSSVAVAHSLAGPDLDNMARKHEQKARMVLTDHSTDAVRDVAPATNATTSDYDSHRSSLPTSGGDDSILVSRGRDGVCDDSGAPALSSGTLARSPRVMSLMPKDAMTNTRRILPSRRYAALQTARGLARLFPLHSLAFG